MDGALMRARGMAIFVALLVIGLGLVGCSSTPAGGRDRAGNAPTARANKAKAPSYLFVINGEGGAIGGIGDDTGKETLTLTLRGVNDHATQFADRPLRHAYVLSTTDFTDRWEKWFADGAPNAVLSFSLTNDPLPHSIVLQLSKPVYDKTARTLAFTARHLHREPDLSPAAIEPVSLPRMSAPAAFASASLFIDSVGNDAAEALYVIVCRCTTFGGKEEWQYSIWPEYRDLPYGWEKYGFVGTREECLEKIKKLWGMP
jgi:hypothetical protein